MKNKLLACIATAALIITLFACLETTSSPQQYSFCVYPDYEVCAAGLVTECPAGGVPMNECPGNFFKDTDPAQGPISNNGGQEQAQRYVYCIFSEMQMCSVGPFTTCPAGGILGNECPAAFLGAGEGAHINVNESGKHNFCVIPEIQQCLKGPFTECQVGTPANECPNFSTSISSSSNAASSSSNQGASSSSNQNDASSSSNQDDTSSSSSDDNGGNSGISLCAGFNPNTETMHYGIPKKRICDERDGKRYYYTVIGKQTWLAENMKYEGTKDKPMGTCREGTDLFELCSKFGRLYSFSELFCPPGSDCEFFNDGAGSVIDPNKIGTRDLVCPSGWHLPTTAEWEELLAYADPNFAPGNTSDGCGNNSAAIKLKSGLQAAGWLGRNEKPDEYGFAALPAGAVTSVIALAMFNSNGWWWTHGVASEGQPLAKSLRMSSPNTDPNSMVCKSPDGATVDDAYQSYGSTQMSVRCVKDEQRAYSAEPTPPAICPGCATFTDRGQTYPYVTIGGKDWMAKNLNYDAGEGSVCYNNIPQNCVNYGRLYNRKTATTACPSGWHLPSDDDWTELFKAVSGTGTTGLTGAGVKLKAKDGWTAIGGINGTDDIGFAALPGSYGVSLVTNTSRGGFGTAKGAFFWTSSGGGNNTIARHFGPTSADAKRMDNSEARLYSVRCVR